MAAGCYKDYFLLSSSVDSPGTDTDPELKQSKDGDDQWHILVHATK